MERSRVRELHFITPIVNLPSIMDRGILCYELAKQLPHASVADEQVQGRRDNKQVPNGRKLHEYANTYFDARNPMMYKRLSQRGELAVVRVSPEILDLQGAVIADGNAAASATRFDRSPEGLRMLDENRVYAHYWTDQDIWSYYEKKRQRCAEVLVPNLIAPDFLIGCYVCNGKAIKSCTDIVPTLGAEVKKHVFFD
jgi:ssDNA thymidine ADP-ribosyltransferase, DarT